MTTPKRICTRRLGQEVDYGRFTLLELPTVLCAEVKIRPAATFPRAPSGTAAILKP
jgi:hypothetical protein